MTRVLIVEDHEITQKIEIRIFKQLNCIVDVAATGVAALEQAKDNFYDVILMDLGLPDMEGFLVVEAIRKLGNANALVPIVAVTAHSDTAYRALATKVGMNDFMVKPLLPDDCARILGKFTPRHAGAGNLESRE